MNDPSGHWADEGCGTGGSRGGKGCNLPPPIDQPDDDDDDDETDTDGDGIPNVPDPSYPVLGYGRSVQADCVPGNLVECYYNLGIMPEGDYTISLLEYLQLLEAIGYDVDKQGPIINYELRQIYDTPFYDGGGTGGNEKALKGTICIKGLICSSRNEMNYIGQGTWSAGARESPLMSTMVANGWKIGNYGHPASLDTNLHNNVGYYAYMAQHPTKYVLTSLGVRNSFQYPAFVTRYVISLLLNK